MIWRIRCASCGALLADNGELGDDVSTLVVDHMLACPAKAYGHPVFGFVPRWSKSIIYVPEQADEIEVAWTTENWGLPLNLVEAQMRQLT